MVYATTTELANVLGVKAKVPSWSVGNTPTKETIGTGDDSTTLFYLDHQNILSSSYTLYYGATEGASVALTETTHYSLDLTTGTIILTSAGVTLISTDNIYGAYSYITNGMNDAYLVKVIARADRLVNDRIGTVFIDGTATNPTYPSKVDIQPSKGLYDKEYYTMKRPIKDVNSLLASDITASATTIEVTASEGAKFPSTGTIVIGTEKVTYTGITTDTLTGCTRGVGDSTANTHSENDEVHTTVLEISGTEPGTSPTFYVQAWNSNMYLDDDDIIQIYDESPLSTTVLLDNELPSQPGVENRIKITYLYGYDTIPLEITRLSLIFAKKMLQADNISKSQIAGRDEFSPEMFNVDSDDIKEIVSEYKVTKIGNT